MSYRIKFQIWNGERWRTAYCRPDLLTANYQLMRLYGFVVRYFP